MAFNAADFGATPVAPTPAAPSIRGDSPSTPAFNPADYGATPATDTSNDPRLQMAQQQQSAPQGSGFLKNLGGFISGAYKGAASTVSSLGSMGQQGLDAVTKPISEAVTGKPYQPTPTMDQTFEGTNAITPQGTAQNIGFGAEKVGEFLVPGAAAADAGKAAEGASLLEKAPSLVKSAAGAAARVGTDVATNAGITAAQGGSAHDIKTAAVTGGVVSGASEGISKFLSTLPKNAWANILKRTSTQVAKNPELPEQAAAAGLVGTKKGIVTQAQNHIQQLEVSLDDVLKTKTGLIDGEKVASYLDKLKQTYKGIPGESFAANTVASIQQETRDKGMLTLEQANQLKRDIYGVIQKSYGKGALEIPAKAESQKIVAAGLKQEIEKVVPEAKTLNQKQAVYIQIRNALERQLNSGEGKNVAGVHLGMSDLLTGGAIEAGGHPIAAAAAVAGKKVLGSTLVNSSVAKLGDYFNNLSPTQKALFYNGIKGLTTKAVGSVNSGQN